MTHNITRIIGGICGNKPTFFIAASALFLFVTSFYSNYTLADKKNIEIRSLSIRPGVQVGIATLTTNARSDLRELCIALESLSFPRNKQGIRLVPKANVMIFNEGNLSPGQKHNLAQCTDKPLSFPEIDMKTFLPPKLNFDPNEEWENFSKRHGFRPKADRREFPWSYHAMIAFWTVHLWKHPATQNFDTIMRIDSDSCFLEQVGSDLNPGYFSVPAMDDQYVYHSNYYPGAKGVPNTGLMTGLFDFAVDYMKKEGIVPVNQYLWRKIEFLWRNERNLPVFQTNFEITRRQFFQRPDVAKWHDALSESEPFGLWRHRWGDAQTRVFTVAMFAAKNEVLLTLHKGYKHGRGKCSRLGMNGNYDRQQQ